MLLSMLRVGGDMVVVLGSALVLIKQSVHHHFILHSSFSVPLSIIISIYTILYYTVLHYTIRMDIITTWLAASISVFSP